MSEDQQQNQSNEASEIPTSPMMHGFRTLSAEAGTQMLRELVQRVASLETTRKNGPTMGTLYAHCEELAADYRKVCNTVRILEAAISGLAAIAHDERVAILRGNTTIADHPRGIDPGFLQSVEAQRPDTKGTTAIGVVDDDLQELEKEVEAIENDIDASPDPDREVCEECFKTLEVATNLEAFWFNSGPDLMTGQSHKAPATMEVRRRWCTECREFTVRMHQVPHELIEETP